MGNEPYPAILLPEGAGIIAKTNDRVTFNYSVVYGLDEKREWCKIDADLLVTPIPSQYFDSILDKLESSYYITKKDKSFQQFHTRKNSYAEHSADKWWTSKLNEQHLFPYTLRIVTVTTTINLVTGEEFNKIANEKILQLYK